MYLLNSSVPKNNFAKNEIEKYGLENEISYSNNDITFINVNNQLIKIEGNNNQSINWKISEEERIISGYNCIKAFFNKEDGSKIYAWFCPYISSNFGPEGFGKLPGLILGLAVEDGSISYFANSISELNKPINVSFPKHSFIFENKLELEKKISSLITNPLNKKLYHDAIKWIFD